MSEFDWPGARVELDEKADLLLAHALAHYIHDGHPYEMKMRSANALSWIEHGQYVMLVRLDDSSAFWKLRDALAEEHGMGRVR